MLVEHAGLLINEGQEEEFASAMREQGIPILAAMPGVGSVNLGRGVENPDKFILVVEWESMEAHDAFRTHPNYGAFRQVLAPYAKGGAMEHFEMD